VIKYLIRRNHKCYFSSVDTLLQRGVTLEVLKLCIRNLHPGKYPSLISGMCLALTNKKIKFAEDYTKRVLVASAWKYGNSDNYFKMLPKELIKQILNYEHIDDPPYFSAMDLVTRSLTEDDEVRGGEPFFPYFWARWGTVYTSKTALLIAKDIAASNFYDEERASRLMYWFRRILTSNKLRIEMDEMDRYGTSNLTKYCMKSPSEEAFSILKLLLKRKILVKEFLVAPRYLIHDDRGMSHSRNPTTWLAVYHKNMDVVKYLIEQDLLPDAVERTANGNEIESLQEFCRVMRLDATMQEYVTKCRRDCAKK
jgi:hypothetical protein